MTCQIITDVIWRALDSHDEAKNFFERDVIDNIHKMPLNFYVTLVLNTISVNNL